ncbi:MAG TPA: methyltransferase domain-containing protein [Ktedonobacterales bacterium]|nr:methyltransferase domain-containing protein [Ktedonobacterales bacterium]
MPWFRFGRQQHAKDGQAFDARGGAVGGRRFARGVPYVLPSDDEEINRLDFQHYMLRYALRGNYAAPLRQPREVLDVACGTGRWCIEMAALFPQANVVGLDITSPPVVEADAPRPANFVFVAGNMLEGLPFADNSFDFVHQRLVIGALPTAQWLAQVQELLRVARRGGWVELVETGTLPGGPGLQTLNDIGEQISEKRGISLNNGSKVGEYLRLAGARQVEQRTIRLPVGKKAGHLGAMAETDYLAAIASMRGFLIAQGLITEEEHNQAVAQAREELASGTLTWPFYVAFGQK